MHGSPAQVNLFRQLLVAIDTMCAAGASRRIELVGDGDGATDLRVLERGARLPTIIEEERFFILRESRSARPPPG